LKYFNQNLFEKDEFPLASLPLLGYIITIPNEKDNINKDYVFKLKFKNHMYFFRAESQYSFERYKQKIRLNNKFLIDFKFFFLYFRWLEVISSAAQKKSDAD
jgi:hypothetical protein